MRREQYTLNQVVNETNCGGRRGGMNILPWSMEKVGGDKEHDNEGGGGGGGYEE